MPGLNTLLTLGAKAGERVGTALADIGKGIRAYHSSPHDFERFDLSKIGTGEGAQMYGRGLYFAENPAVSGQGGQYWKQFLGKFQGTPEGEAARELMHSGFDRAKAIDMLERDLRGKRELGLDALNPEYAQTRVALERLRSGKPVGPRTYEVNINADPAQFLDWDKRLKEQAPAVQDVLGQLGITSNLEKMTPEGSAIYGRIARGQARSGGGPEYFNKPQASEALREAGIPGIKYLDQGSRTQLTPAQISDLQASIAKKEAAHARDPWLTNPEANTWGARNVAALEDDKLRLKNALQPTSNYVLFRDDIIDILRKYGLAGAAPAGGALMMQPSDERQ